MVKRIIAVVGLVTLCLFGEVVTSYALDFPEPQGYVNDFANILSSETRETLEQNLTQLEEDSSIEIALVTIESLEEITIEDYAVRLFEDWKIGKKNKDNGVLLLIVLNEQELRIEVGYGLEPTLTDSRAGRIIRDIITPEFKKGDYDAGAINGVEAIVKVIHGEIVDLGGESSSDSKSKGAPFFILFIIIVILLSYLSSFLARSKSFWLGGVIGAILGGVLGLILFASLLTAVTMAVFLSLLGLIFDYILSKNYKQRKSKGLPTSWRQSGGGFFGAGKSSKSSGFGGFGGGSSGGGGASGSW